MDRQLCSFRRARDWWMHLSSTNAPDSNGACLCQSLPVCSTEELVATPDDQRIEVRRQRTSCIGISLRRFEQLHQGAGTCLTGVPADDEGSSREFDGFGSVRHTNVNPVVTRRDLGGRRGPVIVVPSDEFDVGARLAVQRFEVVGSLDKNADSRVGHAPRVPHLAQIHHPRRCPTRNWMDPDRYLATRLSHPLVMMEV